MRGAREKESESERKRERGRGKGEREYGVRVNFSTLGMQTFGAPIVIRMWIIPSVPGFFVERLEF